MCSHDGDYDFGMYGGSWERHDPCRGRVGSAFYEAGAPVRVAEQEVIETPQEPTPTQEPTPRRYTPDELHPKEARRPNIASLTGRYFFHFASMNFKNASASGKGGSPRRRKMPL